MPYINTTQDFRRAITSGPYAWPGGYDIFFTTTDGGALCYSCAEKERRLILDSIAHRYHDGWTVDGYDCTANYDQPLLCDHCNYTIICEDN